MLLYRTHPWGVAMVFFCSAFVIKYRTDPVAQDGSGIRGLPGQKTSQLQRGFNDMRLPGPLQPLSHHRCGVLELFVAPVLEKLIVSRAENDEVGLVLEDFLQDR